MPQEMLPVVICKYMSWTYQEYINQPDSFIQLILIEMRTTARAQKAVENLNKKRSSSY